MKHKDYTQHAHIYGCSLAKRLNFGELTKASLLVTLSLWPPSAAAAQPLQDDVDMREDDERWGQDGAVMEGHDQLVSLELPHLVRDGLHLEEGVAVKEEEGALIGKTQRWKGSVDSMTAL